MAELPGCALDEPVPPVDEELEEPSTVAVVPNNRPHPRDPAADSSTTGTSRNVEEGMDMGVSRHLGAAQLRLKGPRMPALPGTSRITRHVRTTGGSVRGPHRFEPRDWCSA